jgi:hypothetical protein
VTSPQSLIGAVQRAIDRLGRRKTKFTKDALRTFEASLLREAAARTGGDPEIIVAIEACARDVFQAPFALTPAGKEQRVAALRRAIAILSQELDPTPLERAIAEATQ